jgi:hypothetical protein
MNNFNNDDKLISQYHFVLSMVVTAVLFYALVEFFPVAMGWGIAISCILSAVVHAVGYWTPLEKNMFAKMPSIWEDVYVRKGLIVSVPLIWSVILLAAQIPSLLLAVAFFALSVDAILRVSKV